MKFKLTLAQNSQTPEAINKLIKSKVNPTEINVGITSPKSLSDGRASRKLEIQALGEKIGEKCGEELEDNIQKLSNTRLVLLTSLRA